MFRCHYFCHYFPSIGLWFPSTRHPCRLTELNETARCPNGRWRWKSRAIRFSLQCCARSSFAVGSPSSAQGIRRWIEEVSSVALSGTARWLAAGTAQGRITIWDQTRPDAPRQIAFPRGSSNDLQFSPDERALVIAAEDLGICAPAESAAPRLLRSDRANYGSARFSRDGQTLLAITGANHRHPLGSIAAEVVLFVHL